MPLRTTLIDGSVWHVNKTSRVATASQTCMWLVVAESNGEGTLLPVPTLESCEKITLEMTAASPQPAAVSLSAVTSYVNCQMGFPVFDVVLQHLYLPQMYGRKQARCLIFVFYMHVNLCISLIGFALQHVWVQYVGMCGRVVKCVSDLCEVGAANLKTVTSCCVRT